MEGIEQSIRRGGGFAFRNTNTIFRKLMLIWGCFFVLVFIIPITVLVQYTK